MGGRKEEEAGEEEEEGEKEEEEEEKGYRRKGFTITKPNCIKTIVSAVGNSLYNWKTSEQECCKAEEKTEERYP